jgi:hypothetical protein
MQRINNRPQIHIFIGCEQCFLIKLQIGRCHMARQWPTPNSHIYSMFRFWAMYFNQITYPKKLPPTGLTLALANPGPVLALRARQTG